MRPLQINEDETSTNFITYTVEQSGAYITKNYVVIRDNSGRSIFWLTLKQAARLSEWLKEAAQDKPTDPEMI